MIVRLTLVLFSIAAYPAIAQSQSPAIATTQSSGAGRTATTMLLREGTRVGPMTGRFVRSGTRWRFSPDPLDAVAGVDRSIDLPSLIEARSSTTADALRTRQPDRRVASAPVALPSLGQPEPVADGFADARTRQAMARILVIENLMLERITRSIDDDSSDSRWSITGTITEFRDENRLWLSTVQRAPMQSETLTGDAGR